MRNNTQLYNAFKQFSKVFNGIGKRKGGNKRKRRNRVNALKQKAINMRTGVQSMGPGTTTLCVNDFWTITSGTAVRDIINTAVSGEEFQSRKPNYKYCKIKGVRITIYPYTSTTNTMIYINFRYGVDGAMDSTNIMNDDSSKVFSSYLTRPITYKFLPPNITFNKLFINDMLTYTRSYNLCEFIETNDAPIVKSSLNVYNSGNTTINIQTEVIFLFRGSTYDAAITKINARLAGLNLEQKEKILNEIIKGIEEGKEEQVIGKEEEEEEKEEEDKKEEVKKKIKKKKKDD